MRAFVKKGAQARIIPTDDVVFLRQIKDHAVHFGGFATEPRRRRSRRGIRVGWEHRNSISRKWPGSDPRWCRCPGRRRASPTSRLPPPRLRHELRSPRKNRALSRGGPLIRIRGPWSGGARLDLHQAPRGPAGAYSVRSMKYHAPISASASDAGQSWSGSLPSAATSARIAWRAAFPSAIAARESLGFDTAAS